MEHTQHQRKKRAKNSKFKFGGKNKHNKIRVNSFLTVFWICFQVLKFEDFIIVSVSWMIIKRFQFQAFVDGRQWATQLDWTANFWQLTFWWRPSATKSENIFNDFSYFFWIWLDWRISSDLYLNIDRISKKILTGFWQDFDNILTGFWQDFDKILTEI